MLILDISSFGKHQKALEGTGRHWKALEGTGKHWKVLESAVHLIITGFARKGHSRKIITVI
jgi:hypothetical protein